MVLHGKYLICYRRSGELIGAHADSGTALGFQRACPSPAGGMGTAWVEDATPIGQ